jgi:hypothetical protein
MDHKTDHQVIKILALFFLKLFCLMFMATFALFQDLDLANSTTMTEE